VTSVEGGPEPGIKRIITKTTAYSKEEMCVNKKGPPGFGKKKKSFFSLGGAELTQRRQWGDNRTGGLGIGKKGLGVPPVPANSPEHGEGGGGARPYHYKPQTLRHLIGMENTNKGKSENCSELVNLEVKGGSLAH